jgi:caspase domain-containing protein
LVRLLSEDKSRTESHNGKEGKKARIIAVREYDNLPKGRQLPFCENDGKAVYEVLKAQKYDISDDRKLIGRVEEKILRNVILDFFRRSAKPDDTLFFYFSGH